MKVPGVASPCFIAFYPASCNAREISLAWLKCGSRMYAITCSSDENPSNFCSFWLSGDEASPVASYEGTFGHSAAEVPYRDSELQQALVVVQLETESSIATCCACLVLMRDLCEAYSHRVQRSLSMKKVKIRDPVSKTDDPPPPDTASCAPAE